MTQFEDIRMLVDSAYCKKSYGKEHPDRFIAKESEDLHGVFWRCMAVFEGKSGFGIRLVVCSTDTFEELSVWCDLHNVKLHHVERLNN